MGEMTILEAASDFSPLVFIAVLSYYVLKTFWPWYTNIHQGNLNRRVTQELEREKSREAWTRELMQNIMNMAREYQNGWRAKDEREHAEILRAVYSLEAKISSSMLNGPTGKTHVKSTD